MESLFSTDFEENHSQIVRQYSQFCLHRLSHSNTLEMEPEKEIFEVEMLTDTNENLKNEVSVLKVSD